MVPKRSRQLFRPSSAELKQSVTKTPLDCYSEYSKVIDLVLCKHKERRGAMLVPRSRDKGDRLTITRSLDPIPVGIGWASQRCFTSADFHQMSQDLAELLWIGDIGIPFTIPFGRSYLKTVCTSLQAMTDPLPPACEQTLLSTSPGARRDSSLRATSVWLPELSLERSSPASRTRGLC